MHPILEQLKEVSQERARKLAMAMEFIPKERLHWRLPDCDKSPLELYLECSGAFLMTAKLLRGEQVKQNALLDLVLPESEGFPDLEGAKAMMARFQREFFDALENLDESKLNEIMDLPSGDKATLAKVVLGPVQKVCYLCGQLDYYSALLKIQDSEPL